MAKLKSRKKELPLAANDKGTLNLSKTPPQSIVRINMLLPHEKKKEIKQFANDHDMTITEVLLNGFECLRGKNQ